MASDKNRQKYQTALYLENKVKELHNNIRHVTQLAMNWFAFLVTINYFTMGWLAKGSGNERPDTNIIWIVAVVFIVQNSLGVFGIFLVAWRAYSRAVHIKTYEKLIIKLSDVIKRSDISEKEKKDLDFPSTPIRLYICIAGALMFVLLSLVWAWIYIYYHYK